MCCSVASPGAQNTSPDTLKSMKHDTIQKIHAPNIQVRVFSREKNDCDKGKHMNHGVLGGTLKSMSIDKIQKIHVNKIPGRVLPGRKAFVAGTSSTAYPKSDEHRQTSAYVCKRTAISEFTFKFVKYSNLYMNTFHASNRPMEPYMTSKFIWVKHSRL